MARIRCPKCKSGDVDMLGVKTRTKLCLNPFKPFTLTKQVPEKVQRFHCRKCGKTFERKI